MSGDRGSARRLVGLYKVFCAVFAACLLIYAGARIGLLRAGHQEEARAAFQSVRAAARTAMSAFEARDDSYFSGAMRQISQGQSDLLLLAVHEAGRGVYYFLARDTGLFPAPPTPTSDMTFVPEYRAPALTTLRLISTFTLGDRGRTITVETLYSVLGAADLHRLGKEIAYILLVFLIITATMLIVATSVSPTSAGARPEPRARPSSPPPSASAILRPTETTRPTPSPVPSPAPSSSVGSAQREERASTPSKSIYSDATGLVYRDFLSSRLRSEIERAAASDQDMVLAMIAIDGVSPAENHRLYAAVASRLREAFPYRDLLFEHEQGYAVIIPDINLDKALERLEDLRAQLGSAPIEGRSITVSVGIGARNGRLIGDETLLKEASHSLAKAIRDGADQVVAFRADPDKFRRALAT